LEEKARKAAAANATAAAETKKRRGTGAQKATGKKQKAVVSAFAAAGSVEEMAESLHTVALPEVRLAQVWNS
jgi:hypothetical protein